jgi:hypothetical protein
MRFAALGTTNLLELRDVFAYETEKNSRVVLHDRQKEGRYNCPANL